MARPSSPLSPPLFHASTDIRAYGFPHTPDGTTGGLTVTAAALSFFAGGAPAGGSRDAAAAAVPPPEGPLPPSVPPAVIPMTSLILHAVCRDTSVFPHPCLYVQLDGEAEGGGDASAGAELPGGGEVRLVVDADMEDNHNDDGDDGDDDDGGGGGCDDDGDGTMAIGRRAWAVMEAVVGVAARCRRGGAMWCSCEECFGVGAVGCPRCRLVDGAPPRPRPRGVGGQTGAGNMGGDAVLALGRRFLRQRRMRRRRVGRHDRRRRGARGAWGTRGGNKTGRVATQQPSPLPSHAQELSAERAWRGRGAGAVTPSDAHK